MTNEERLDKFLDCAEQAVCALEMMVDNPFRDNKTLLVQMDMIRQNAKLIEDYVRIRFNAAALKKMS